MKIRIEVPFSLVIFAYVFADSITTNWIMYKICYVTLGYNKSECALLETTNPSNSTPELTAKVQPYVAVISMAKTLIEAFGSAIVCFFIGPWSDKYGRKPALLLTFGGYTIAYTILAVVSAFPHLSPWFILLFIIPICFSGGLMAIYSVALSYIADITTPEKRGISMVIFYANATAGLLLGSLSSSFALAALGYIIMYIISACCIFVAWLLIILFVPESLPNPETEGKIRNLFRLSLMKATVKTTFMKRDSYGRSILLIIITWLVVYLLAQPGEPCIYFYVQKKFHWSLEKFTVYKGINTVTEVIGSILGIYFLRKLLGVKESIVIMLGFCSIFCGTLLLGLAATNWEIYAAASSTSFRGIITPLSRSLVTQIVPPEDTGKVFSFIAVCETLISPLTSPLYTFIYNSTLATFPEAFNFVTAGIYLVGIILSITVIMLEKKQDELVPYEEMPSEPTC